MRFLFITPTAPFHLHQPPASTPFHLYHRPASLYATVPPPSRQCANRTSLYPLSPSLYQPRPPATLPPSLPPSLPTIMATTNNYNYIPSSNSLPFNNSLTSNGYSSYGSLNLGYKSLPPSSFGSRHGEIFDGPQDESMGVANYVPIIQNMAINYRYSNQKRLILQGELVPLWGLNNLNPSHSFSAAPTPLNSIHPAAVAYFPSVNTLSEFDSNFWDTTKDTITQAYTEEYANDDDDTNKPTLQQPTMILPLASDFELNSPNNNTQHHGFAAFAIQAVSDVTVPSNLKTPLKAYPGDKIYVSFDPESGVQLWNSPTHTTSDEEDDTGDSTMSAAPKEVVSADDADAADVDAAVAALAAADAALAVAKTKLNTDHLTPALTLVDTATTVLSTLPRSELFDIQRAKMTSDLDLLKSNIESFQFAMNKSILDNDYMIDKFESEINEINIKLLNSAHNFRTHWVTFETTTGGSSGLTSELVDQFDLISPEKAGVAFSDILSPVFVKIAKLNEIMSQQQQQQQQAPAQKNVIDANLTDIKTAADDTEPVFPILEAQLILLDTLNREFVGSRTKTSFIDKIKDSRKKVTDLISVIHEMRRFVDADISDGKNPTGYLPAYKHNIETSIPPLYEGLRYLSKLLLTFVNTTNQTNKTLFATKVTTTIAELNSKSNQEKEDFTLSIFNPLFQLLETSSSSTPLVPPVSWRPSSPLTPVLSTQTITHHHIFLGIAVLGIDTSQGDTQLKICL
jgi:hypothetical protein